MFLHVSVNVLLMGGFSHFGLGVSHFGPGGSPILVPGGRPVRADTLPGQTPPWIDISDFGPQGADTPLDRRPLADPSGQTPPGIWAMRKKL